MLIARVLGTAVSTVKDDRLDGMKLLIVAPADTSGKVVGDPAVAADLVGAGEGELVLVAQGSTARLAGGTSGAPVDAVIIGILNNLSSDGRATYQKE